MSVMKSSRTWLGAIAVLSISACSPTHGLPELSSPDAATYRLGPGDQVRVLTYNDPQMSNTFTVGDDGRVAFPLIGTVTAAGLTPNELAERLTGILVHKGVLSKPSVSVEVAQYRPIFVLGEVNHPGEYRYIPGMTMQSAVALAGGYTYRAITNTAQDIRTEGTPDGKPLRGKIKPDSVLRAGDVITIMQRWF
ncbi:polysaccharide biosynthesis/export family protein [Kozakia baliensis]|uniref:polysaccharide biosynthesis/export family protein n=1 Tax=Kozakia baliensis TaxID=153496 RepID=UPI00345BB4A7